jgi:hypothetical protein
MTLPVDTPVLYAAADRWWAGLRRGVAGVEPVTGTDLEAGGPSGRPLPTRA